MRQLRITRNILCGVLFAFCVIPLGVLYKIEEGFILTKRKKRKVNLDAPANETFKTVYPDDMPANFNQWFEHIHREYQKN